MDKLDLPEIFSGSRDNKQAIESLIQRLKDRDVSVQVRAAEFLGISGDVRAVEPLITLLRDEDPNVRWAAASALGRLGDRRAVKPLIDALRDTSWGVHRRWAAAALGDLCDASAVEPLIQVLADEHSEVRSFAASALAKLGDTRAVGHLTDLLKGKGPRHSVAQALLQFGTAAMESLVELLIHPDKDVRFYAAEALGKLQDPRAIDPMLRLLADEHILVRKKAIKALVNIGPPSVPALIDILKHENQHARLSSCEALGQLGDARAIGPLTQLLEDKHDLVRAKAAKAITELEL